MQLRTGSENNDHLPRQARDEHRESSKTGRCFVCVFVDRRDCRDQPAAGQGENTGCLRHLYIKTIFLPRQTRDKQRKALKKSPFFLVG
eukprot:COSAG06_NODE_995_length_11158_cov_10.796184_7_plen_88_part_00